MYLLLFFTYNFIEYLIITRVGFSEYPIYVDMHTSIYYYIFFLKDKRNRIKTLVIYERKRQTNK